VTIDAAANGTTPGTLPCRISRPRPLGEVTHGLTHRRYRFEVFTCAASAKKTADDGSRKWVTLKELDDYPLPRPHLKIVELLRNPEGLT